MSITLLFTPQQAFDGGVFAPGAKAYFYETRTTTPVIVYSDAAYTTPHASPLVADASGVFAQVFFGGSTVVKAVISDADDTTIATVDPVAKVSTSESQAAGITFSPISGNSATTVQAAIASNTAARVNRSADVKTLLASADLSEMLSNLGLTAASPAGMVMAYAGATAPSGWLVCDGTAVSRTTYASLFAVISTIYGSGDGSTTFNLPDYRGEFLRGVDDGATNDPDASSRTDRGDGTTGDVVGTKQADEFKSHTHPPPTADAFLDASGATAFGGTGANLGSQAATGASGGNETRPRNVSVLYCIKT